MLKKIKSILHRNQLLYNLLFNLYKTIVLLFLYPYRAKKNFSKFKKYYFNNSTESISEAIKMLNTNNKLMIPFKFINKYDKINYEIIHDDFGYPAVKINNNLIFFPKETTNKDILGSVKTHFIEQDEESPHKYFIDKSQLFGHTAILVGASDGLLALDLIDSFKHIYLIESDKNWIEPLKKTFCLFKEKITILNIYASDISTGNQKKLDDIFKSYEHSIDFLQADVEGAAGILLKGAENMLYDHMPKIAIACYHTHNEASDIKNILEKFNYKTSFSQKFVYNWNHYLQEPFIRKGVIYADK